jgi:hypothetical protein
MQERRLHVDPGAEGPYNVFVSMPFGKDEDAESAVYRLYGKSEAIEKPRLERERKNIEMLFVQ